MPSKVMIVGDYNWEIYEKALAEGFEENGVVVYPFKIKSYSFFSRLFVIGQLIKVNNDLEKKVLELQPNILFFYRCNEVFPSTLNKIKKWNVKTKTILYHNDNPYIGYKNRIKYYLFLNLVPLVDIVYVYRPSNIADVVNMNAKTVKLLYPHYYSKKDVVKTVDFDIKNNDVVFIGHFEPNRGKDINALIDNRIDVKVFGPGWDDFSKKHSWATGVVNPPVYGESYRKTLNESKVALCFLSKINKDVYTRRSFEIPAAGTLMVTEYTKELCSIFSENKDILMFKSREELIKKITIVLNNKNLLVQMTNAGHTKVLTDGHSEVDRAKQIIEDMDL